MKQERVDTEVMTVLSTDWQTRKQLEKKLEARRKRSRSTDEPTEAQVYFALDRLRTEGHVESQETDTPKSLGNPFGRVIQYRLRPTKRRPVPNYAPTPYLDPAGAVPLPA